MFSFIFSCNKLLFHILSWIGSITQTTEQTEHKYINLKHECPPRTVADRVYFESSIERTCHGSTHAAKDLLAANPQNVLRIVCLSSQFQFLFFPLAYHWKNILFISFLFSLFKLVFAPMTQCMLSRIAKHGYLLSNLQTVPFGENTT